MTWTRGERPRIEPLPGRLQRDADGPPDTDDERTFFALRKQAQEARLGGEHEGAVELYRRALALWAGHGDCLYYLGNSLLALDQEADALAAFERLVHFEKQSSQGWMQIGLLRLPGGDAALDDLMAAEAAFRRCHELNGEESRPTLQLGIVAMLRDELEEAAGLLSDAARLNPSSIEARWFAARVAFLRGERERSHELLAQAAELDRRTGAGESASNEGDTASGQAMIASEGVELAPTLTRWRGIGQRAVDVEIEFGSRD